MRIKTTYYKGHGIKTTSVYRRDKTDTDVDDEQKAKYKWLKRQLSGIAVFIRNIFGFDSNSHGKYAAHFVQRETVVWGAGKLLTNGFHVGHRKGENLGVVANIVHCANITFRADWYVSFGAQRQHSTALLSANEQRTKLN